MPGVRSRADARAGLIADEAIRAVGPLARAFRIDAEIARRCALAGLEPPSGAAVRARIARQKWLAEWDFGGGVRLVVDQTRIQGIVMADGAIGDVLLTIAMLDPTGAVVAHALDEAGHGAERAMAALLAGMMRVHRAGPRVVARIPALSTGHWRHLRRAAAEDGAEIASPTWGSLRLGREIDAILGRRFWIPLSTKPRAHPPTDVGDLGRRIDDAVRRSNAAGRKATTGFSLPNVLQSDESDALERFARGERRAPGSWVQSTGHDRNPLFQSEKIPVGGVLHRGVGAK